MIRRAVIVSVAPEDLTQKRGTKRLSIDAGLASEVCVRGGRG